MQSIIKSVCPKLAEHGNESMTGLTNIQNQIDELYGMVEQQNKELIDIDKKSSKFIFFSLSIPVSNFHQNFSNHTLRCPFYIP